LSGALEGLQVADFTQLVQGPNATQSLGDMGADIIKIEPRNGEWHRHWSMRDSFLNGESLSFLVFNRAKRSITLNVKDPRGKQAALRIIESSDVLIENFRPGVMDRLGIGYDASGFMEVNRLALVDGKFVVLGRRVAISNVVWPGGRSGIRRRFCDTGRYRLDRLAQGWTLNRLSRQMPIRATFASVATWPPRQ